MFLVFENKFKLYSLCNTSFNMYATSCLDLLLAVSKNYESNTHSLHLTQLMYS